MASLIKGAMEAVQGAKSALEIPQMKAKRDEKKEELAKVEKEIEEVEKQASLKSIEEVLFARRTELAEAVLSNPTVLQVCPMQAAGAKSALDQLYDALKSASDAQDNRRKALIKRKEDLEKEIKQIKKKLDKARGK